MAIAAVDPDRGVDAVGEEVAGDARAGRIDVEPPGAGAALRHVGEIVQSCRNLAR